MYKFGFGCFGFLALISLGWICFGLAATSSAASQIQANPPAATRSPYLSANDEKAINQASVGIASGLTMSVFACTGLPAAAFCMLLSLLCFFGWQAERRHQERLTADYARNEILGNMAVAQMAQAQLLNNRQQEQNSQRRFPYHKEE